MRFFEIISQMSMEDRDKFLLNQGGNFLSLWFDLGQGSIKKILVKYGLRYDTVEELNKLSEKSCGFDIR